MRRVLPLLLLSLVLMPRHGEAIPGSGMAVFDIAVEWQAAITAIQTTAIAANQILDMETFGDLVLDTSDYATDLQELSALLVDAQGLAWDVTALMAQYEYYFGLEGLPDTSDLYALRRHEVRVLVMDGYRHAMRMQTLVMRTIQVMQRLLAFVQRIGRVIGNVQVAQTVSEGLQQLNATALQAHAIRTVFERAQSLERADEASSIESLHVINKNIWRHWPGMAK